MPANLENVIKRMIRVYARDLASGLQEGAFEGDDRLAVVGALSWLVESDDCIPDLLPVVGYLDDALTLINVLEDLRARDRLPSNLDPLQIQDDAALVRKHRGLLMRNLVQVRRENLILIGSSILDLDGLISSVRLKLTSL